VEEEKKAEGKAEEKKKEIARRQALDQQLALAKFYLDVPQKWEKEFDNAWRLNRFDCVKKGAQFTKAHKDILIYRWDTTIWNTVEALLVLRIDLQAPQKVSSKLKRTLCAAMHPDRWREASEPEKLLLMEAFQLLSRSVEAFEFARNIPDILDLALSFAASSK